MDENSKVYKLKMFINECKRVLRVTKRPDSFEFKTIVKVSGLGMAIIGLLGFLISMIKALTGGV
jgi:protein transport protein SEC61 subunit gamma-like protein